MNTIKIVKNTVEFEINITPDIYGQLSVTARVGENKTTGKIPGCATHSYSRIEFLYNYSEWLQKLADHRYINQDDFEDSQTISSFEFDLTADEIAIINAAREPMPAPATEPEPTTARAFDGDTDSGLGIGGINNDQSISEISLSEIEPANLVKCSCGHAVPASLVMSASTGTSCPDCYDRMSL